MEQQRISRIDAIDHLVELRLKPMRHNLTKQFQTCSNQTLQDEMNRCCATYANQYNVVNDIEI